jgi:hypothetical protein
MGFKADVEEVPTVALEFFPGLLRLYGSGIVMMKQYPTCQLAWTFSANFIPKLQQNFTVRCRIHVFAMLLKMG